DLQLPPAFCLPSAESVSRAMEPAYDCDVSSHISQVRFFRGCQHLTFSFSILNIDPNAQNDSITKCTTKFSRSASQHHTLITPLTPLAELAESLRPSKRSCSLLTLPKFFVQCQV
ncbi:uncharacterized protein BJ212DRAFT_1277286, partial [Suillus subaureus]